MVVVFPITTPEAMVTVGPTALVTAASELVGAASTGEMASSPSAMNFAGLKIAIMSRSECAI